MNTQSNCCSEVSHGQPMIRRTILRSLAARANIRAMLDQAVCGALPNEGARRAVGIDHFLRQG
ncbi:MAG: hypothetical protein ISP43_05985 [Candidatus Puniceispirillum sp.]|nr:hypothetical protein [Candidatus Puniceispirillum sp.]